LTASRSDGAGEHDARPRPGNARPIVGQPSARDRLRCGDRARRDPAGPRRSRVPDLAVTCAADDPPSHALIEPILLVEILSPSNEPETRANVWSYTTIPSVREILPVRSTHIGAELIRREPDGGWPANSRPLGEEDRLALDSIGFECPLAAVYAGTRLVPAAAAG
jgi:Uma2 family endonuclease